MAAAGDVGHRGPAGGMLPDRPLHEGVPIGGVGRQKRL